MVSKSVWDSRNCCRKRPFSSQKSCFLCFHSFTLHLPTGMYFFRVRKLFGTTSAATLACPMQFRPSVEFCVKVIKSSKNVTRVYCVRITCKNVSFCRKNVVKPSAKFSIKISKFDPDTYLKITIHQKKFPKGIDT